MAGIYIIFGILTFISYLVSNRLKSKFRKYSQYPTQGHMTGKEVAEKMLRDHGIHDVKVVSVRGMLTDHYNPAKKTVNLSEGVYSQANIAAAAVAAHECGHAIQHAEAYAWLQLRSKLVPVVSFTSRWVQWVLLAGILMVQTFPQLLLIGIIMFAMSTLFAFITLPVEINASQRALKWLERANITPPQYHKYAKDALKWAAYTYVVAAISALATLMYYIMIYTRRR